MNRIGQWPSEPSQASEPDFAQLRNALRPYAPAVLFGLRFWASVCLALYIAFLLQLDDPQWAGASAAIVCQPSVGASLRKGWFRVIGTVIGAVAIVVLTGLCVQSRTGFLLGLALWGAVCAFAATILQNFASYSAALAGYTAAIIAADELGAVGGANGDVFILALTRAIEICLGIVCAGVVMAGTNFGTAPRRFAHQLAMLSTEIAGMFFNTFSQTKSELSETRIVRRDLVGRVIALDPLIDEVIGESSTLRYHAARLYATRDGLFAALSCWRTTAVHLEAMGSRADAEPVERLLPDHAQPLSVDGYSAPGHADDLWHERQAYAASIRALISLPNATPSGQLLADQTAGALIGIRRAINGLLLIADPKRAPASARLRWLGVPDYLVPTINALRVFLAVIAAELFWIVTAWPDGGQAIAFAAIVVILFSPRAEVFYGKTMSIMAATIITVAAAAIVSFAVLPAVTTFVGFSMAIGLVLFPTGVLMAMGWQPVVISLMAATFIPILSPANQMTYNTTQFYNVVLGVVAGVIFGILSFHLLPPLSPAVRTCHLLKLTLRDLQRLIGGRLRTARDWTHHIYGRLSQLPMQATPLQRAELMAALSVGTEIIRLRRVARRLDHDSELKAALACVAYGDCRTATEHLAQFDQRLAAFPRATSRVILRARASILAISESLEQHADYFNSAARP